MSTFWKQFCENSREYVRFKEISCIFLQNIGIMVSLPKKYFKHHL